MKRLVNKKLSLYQRIRLNSKLGIELEAVFD
jgi:hypothetical protein